MMATITADAPTRDVMMTMRITTTADVTTTEGTETDKCPRYLDHDNNDL